MTSLIRFELLRLLRQPRSWLSMAFFICGGLISMLGSGPSPLLFAQMITFSVIGGMIASSAYQVSREESMGADAAYLVTRGATRSRLIAARFVALTALGAVLWSLAWGALAIDGKISGGSTVDLDWEVVTTTAGGSLRPRVAPAEQARIADLIADGREVSWRSVQVVLPWFGAAAAVITLLALLVGLAAGLLHIGPGGHAGAARRPWRPASYLGMLPMVGALALVLGPFAAGGGVMAGHQRLMVWLYLHVEVVVALGLAVVAGYLALAQQSLRRAEL